MPWDRSDFRAEKQGRFQQEVEQTAAETEQQNAAKEKERLERQAAEQAAKR